MIISFCAASQAAAETRSLKLYFIHTKERAEIVYKRNGRYDKSGIKQINRFLRDWRRNESANMDPRLLDLVWEVYRAVGARDYIHVVSAYRSPATNASLRKRSSGVAEKSQHMLGKAMDFYIPGVKLSKLRATAFKAQGGGVGYYPKSGAPFVHLDVGNVRSWPRMSRNELLALFPDGQTMHLPTDGKPLPGYNQALAAYKARQRSGASVQIASASDSGRSSGGGFLAALFRGGADQEEDEAESTAPVAVAAAPVRQQPAAQPEPQRETPETIIAALPERSVPLPGVAPRPLVDVGAPSAPLIEGMPASATAQAEAEPEAIQTALIPVNVPLPSWRPGDVPSETATQIAAVKDGDLPVSAIAAEMPRGSGSEAISDMLAMSAAEARADVVINAPVPGLRPRHEEPETAKAQLASLDRNAAGDIFALASLPQTGMATKTDAAPVARATPTVPDETRVAAFSASPRVAIIGRKDGSDAVAALDSGVRTTSKSAKPRAVDSRNDPKSVVVPVEHELTRWAFQRDVTVATAGGSANPAMAHKVVWSAPSTVYTAGFRQEGGQAQPNRFTGKAVTFMSVARFETN